MGEVWLAEQTEPVQRKVALKLIKLGMDTKGVVARFESERQALAMMEHPSIAKVYDAGATPTGRPYFAMQYIKRVPITTHCDRQRLSNRERLELFLQVCEGVQHAHHKAVIHRDLKPSNVLITIVDGKPLPKTIDFGLAKASLQTGDEHPRGEAGARALGIREKRLISAGVTQSSAFGILTPGTRSSVARTVNQLARASFPSPMTAA